jgi:hypothetical protein
VLTVFTPTHVSFGAGTLRCGTVFHPAIDSELGHICAQATAEHLRFAEVLSAILAAPALPLRFVRQARPRTLLLVLLAVAAFAALAMLWMAAVYEYSPELMIPV